MNGNEHLKTKMHFTLSLLGAIFALHPFYHYFDEISFIYMDTVVPLSYAFLAIGVFLALAVYFYATDLVNENPSLLSQRLGNYFYGAAMLTAPFYLGMYLSTLLEDTLIQKGILSKYHLNVPVFTTGILLFWVFMWVVCGFFIRRHLAKKDWTSRVEFLIDKEMYALKRAKEMMLADHYDLAILQYHKALTARLKMACAKKGVFQGEPFISAKHLGIISKTNGCYIDCILRNTAIAQSTEPATKTQAEETALHAKKVLSTIQI